MYGVIPLDPDELLICLFFRADGDPPASVEARDFERRLHLKPQPEGGISFFRA
jgi:hypothetical protein